MQFRFSRRAEADLKEIAAYIARDNPARGLRLCNSCANTAAGWLRSRGARRLRPELGEGVRLSVFAITWCSTLRTRTFWRSAASCMARAILPTSTEERRCDSCAERIVNR